MNIILIAWQYDLYAAAYCPPGTSRPSPAGANVGADGLEFYPQNLTRYP